jgi:hypothetical protein
VLHWYTTDEAGSKPEGSVVVTPDSAVVSRRNRSKQHYFVLITPAEDGLGGKPTVTRMAGASGEEAGAWVSGIKPYAAVDMSAAALAALNDTDEEPEPVRVPLRSTVKVLATGWLWHWPALAHAPGSPITDLAKTREPQWLFHVLAQREALYPDDEITRDTPTLYWYTSDKPGSKPVGSVTLSGDPAVAVAPTRDATQPSAFVCTTHTPFEAAPAGEDGIAGPLAAIITQLPAGGAFVIPLAARKSSAVNNWQAWLTADWQTGRPVTALRMQRCVAAAAEPASTALPISPASPAVAGAELTSTDRASAVGVPGSMPWAVALELAGLNDSLPSALATPLPAGHIAAVGAGGPDARSPQAAEVPQLTAASPVRAANPPDVETAASPAGRTSVKVLSAGWLWHLHATGLDDAALAHRWDWWFHVLAQRVSTDAAGAVVSRNPPVLYWYTTDKAGAKPVGYVTITPDAAVVSRPHASKSHYFELIAPRAVAAPTPGEAQGSTCPVCTAATSLDDAEGGALVVTAVAAASGSEADVWQGRLAAVLRATARAATAVSDSVVAPAPSSAAWRRMLLCCPAATRLRRRPACWLRWRCPRRRSRQAPLAASTSARSRRPAAAAPRAPAVRQRAHTWAAPLCVSRPVLWRLVGCGSSSWAGQPRRTPHWPHPRCRVPPRCSKCWPRQAGAAATSR